MSLFENIYIYMFMFIHVYIHWYIYIYTLMHFYIHIYLFVIAIIIAWGPSPVSSLFMIIQCVSFWECVLTAFAHWGFVALTLVRPRSSSRLLSPILVRIVTVPSSELNSISTPSPSFPNRRLARVGTALAVPASFLCELDEYTAAFCFCESEATMHFV